MKHLDAIIVGTGHVGPCFGGVVGGHKEAGPGR
jgi:hypothetical protein